MKATSVHFKPCNIAASEAHNKRTKELSYVRKDLSHLNESFLYIEHSLRKELSNIAKRVKEMTGRKLQKNAEPIQECVIVIKEDTTIDELKQFCEACRQKFGTTPLQIFTHKDEGHKRSKTWKPNLHAHIVWSVYNEEGRNVHIQRADCCEMQTLAAQCLGMKRGKASGKKHKDTLAYKIEQEEKHLSEVAEMVKNRAKECEAVESTLTDRKSKFEALECEISKMADELNEMKYYLDGETKRAIQLREANKRLERIQDRLNSAVREELIPAVQSVKDEIEGTKAKQSFLGLGRDRKAREDMRNKALEKLEECIDTTLPEIEKALSSAPEEIRQEYRRRDEHEEQNRYHRVQMSRKPTNWITNQDLRAKYPEEAKLLDELNEQLEAEIDQQDIPADTKGKLLRGFPVCLTRRWYDPIKAEYTEETKAELQIRDKKLLFNGLRLRDFLNRIWASMALKAKRLHDRMVNQREDRRAGMKL